MNATMVTISVSPSEPVLPGGMLVKILLYKSLEVRFRQVLMKLPPARGRASLLPLRSGRWQAAQLAW